MRIQLLGIAGSFSSGQDTLARYLRDSYGYAWISTSDMVREEALKRHNSAERPYMVETATYLRTTFGGGVLAQLALDAYTEQGGNNGLVLSGIRSIGEMNIIIKKQGVILYTDANPELRYKRMVERHRDGEALITETAFLNREQAEWHTGDTDADFNKRDIRTYAEAHNMIIWNDVAQEDFFRQATRRLGL